MNGSIPLAAGRTGAGPGRAASLAASRERGFSRSFRTLVVLMAALPWLSVVLADSVIPFPIRVLAGVLWALCLLPAWYYLRTPLERRGPVPLMPFIGLLYGLYFPLSVVLGAENQYYKINVNPAQDYAAPVLLALLGWVFLLLGYAGVQALASSRVRRWELDWDLEVVRRGALLLMFFGLAVEGLRVVAGVPAVVAGLTQFFSSLGYFGMGVLTFLAARGVLDRSSKVLLGAGVVGGGVVTLGTGSVATAVHLVLVLLFSIWVARGTLNPRWVWTALLAVTLLVSMKGVLHEYRRVAWVGEGISLTERVALLGRLVGDRVASAGVAGTLSEGGEALVQRSAVMDLFADVARRTPSEVPYWEGQTYDHLVGIAVPRFLWPGKPVHRLGNEFGQRYGYIPPYDTRTSWNLPVLVEFYVNFGDWGVLVGMLLVGGIYGVFCARLNRAGQNPLVSIAAVILSIKLINIESDFSLVFGALLLHGVALWAVLWVIGYQSRTAAKRKRAKQTDGLPAWVGG